MLTSNMNTKTEPSVLGLIDANPVPSQTLLTPELPENQNKFAKLFAGLLPVQSAGTSPLKFNTLKSVSTSAERFSEKDWAKALNDLAQMLNGLLDSEDAKVSLDNSALSDSLLEVKNALSSLSQFPDVKVLNKVLSENGVSSVEDYVKQSLSPVGQANFAAIDSLETEEILPQLSFSADENPVEQDKSVKVIGLIQNALSAAENLGQKNPLLAGKNLLSQPVFSKDSAVTTDKPLLDDLLTTKALPESIDNISEQALSLNLSQNVGSKAVDSEQLKQQELQAKEIVDNLGHYIRDLAKQHGQSINEGEGKVSISDAVHAFQATYGRSYSKATDADQQLKISGNEQAVEVATVPDNGIIDQSLTDLSELAELATIASAESVESVNVSNHNDIAASDSVIADTINGFKSTDSIDTEQSLQVFQPVAMKMAEQEQDVDQITVAEMSQSLHEIHGVVSQNSASGQQSQVVGQSVSQNVSASSQSTSQAQTIQSTTTWGSAADNSQNASANGQSQQQASQQQSQQFQAQQQLAQLQETLRDKTTGLQQQMAVKASDELARNEVKDLINPAEFSSFDRRAQLPTGFQTIAVPMRSPQWGQALGQRVVFMANNAVQQARITLNPENLGPVQIKLHMDKDQQMHVTMHAQHATTREAMEAAMPRLKEMMEQAGINLASVNIADERQFAEQQSGFGESGKQGGGNGNNVTAEDENELTDGTVKVIGSDNLVDYYA